MKIKALKDFRWQFGREVKSFTQDNVYDVFPTDANKMCAYHYAEPLLNENKMIDISYAKKTKKKVSNI